MANTRTNRKATPARKTYRESIMKPGAARIYIEGSCGSHLLGGSGEDEFCVFRDIEEARAEVETLRNSRDNAAAIDTWEIQVLRTEGEWRGCVAAGVFEHPKEVN